MAIFLSNAEVRSLLPMRECVDLMERVFLDEARGQAANLPRQHIPLPVGFHRTVSGVAHGFGVYGMKTYGSIRKEGWHRTRYLVLLFNLEDGLLEAILEAHDLGQIRTGAVAGLATKYLARDDAHTLGIIGTGWEASAQLEAMTVVREITHLKAYSRSAVNRERFAAEMLDRLGLTVHPVGSAEECVRDVDILVTITNADEPVFEGTSLRPGMHVNAVGATQRHRRELDVEAVRRAELVVVEHPEQSQADCGELIAAADAGVFAWENAVELQSLVVGSAQGRSSPESITLFDSLGVATEDLAAAAFVVEQARAKGIGQELPFA